MHSNDTQKKLNSISAKFGIDQQYTKKFFGDYEFAKAESGRIGLQMPPQLYQQLRTCFKKINKVAIKAETFEKVWEMAVYKKNHQPRSREIVVTLSIITTIVAGVTIHHVLKRFSKR